MTVDAYTFLWVMAAGVLAQALLIVREPRRMAGVMGFAAFAYAVVWIFADRGDDVGFQVAVMGTMLFVLLFAIAYRDLAMPRISRRALLHYSLVWYYGFWLSAQAAPQELPRWIYIGGAVPVVLVALLALWPRGLWRWIRVSMYVWFLLLMMFLLGRQLSGDRLRRVYDESGFSLELFASGFMFGAVFLLFGIYFVYATLLLVIRGRRASMWARLTGARDDSVASEQAGEMARRVSGSALDPVAALLLLLHAAILALNAVYGWIEPALVVNGSIVGIAVVGLPQYQSSPPRTRSSS